MTNLPHQLSVDVDDGLAFLQHEVQGNTPYALHFFLFIHQ